MQKPPIRSSEMEVQGFNARLRKGLFCAPKSEPYHKPWAKVFGSHCLPNMGVRFHFIWTVVSSFWAVFSLPQAGLSLQGLPFFPFLKFLDLVFNGVMFSSAPECLSGCLMFGLVTLLFFAFLWPLIFKRLKPNFKLYNFFKEISLITCMQYFQIMLVWHFKDTFLFKQPQPSTYFLHMISLLYNTLSQRKSPPNCTFPCTCVSVKATAADNIR